MNQEKEEEKEYNKQEKTHEELLNVKEVRGLAIYDKHNYLYDQDNKIEIIIEVITEINGVKTVEYDGPWSMKNKKVQPKNNKSKPQLEWGFHYHQIDCVQLKKSPCGGDGKTAFYNFICQFIREKYPYGNLSDIFMAPFQ